MTEHTKTIVSIVVVVLVLGTYLFVGYCTAISRRQAAPVTARP